MTDFITALQFLTRIRLFSQENWTQEGFSRSVRWFPLVGVVIGSFLAGLNYLLLPYFADFLRVSILLIAEIIITGGLLCDGLMDTADGVFSGRSRERMLEIMKDSRVGVNGVIAFVCLVLLKVALYLALPKESLASLLFAMPIITRAMLVGAITYFKYARPDGTGNLFAKYAKKNYFYQGIVFTVLVLLPLESAVIAFAGLGCLIYCWLFARYLCKILGGLTGDTYGFLVETGNVAFLFLAYLYLVLNSAKVI